MCFSPEASFTAAVVLISIGVATIRQTTRRSQVFLASTPILFGLQQLSEGFVWLGLSYDFLPTQVTQISSSLYSFLAMGFWPFWAPFAALAIEKKPLRQKFIGIFLVLGTLYMLRIVLVLWSNEWKIPAEIVNHSIQYEMVYDFPDQVSNFLIRNLVIYNVCVVIPYFISSFPRLWMYGAALIVAFCISWSLYYLTFFSVWCFFGALSGLVLYWIFKKARGKTISRL